MKLRQVKRNSPRRHGFRASGTELGSVSTRKVELIILSAAKHCSVNRCTPDRKRDRSSGQLINSFMASVSAAGSFGGQSRTFSPSMKGSSNISPRVVTIGRLCAAAAANELLFKRTPTLNGRTQISAVY